MGKAVRDDQDFYEPTARSEILALKEAIEDDNELLDAEAGRKYLVEQLKRHGID